MKNNQSSQTIPLIGPEKAVEINRQPLMGLIFFKALIISFFKPATITDDTILKKTSFFLKNHAPDHKRIEKYKSICGFSEKKSGIIPIPYFQSLFIGLLGKFITSSFFPINPLGLVHIFQSFELKRPVKIHETLDLECTIKRVTKTHKGIETDFSLKVRTENQVVWQGVSTFLTRGPGGKKNKTKKKHTDFLEKKETFFVPPDTGRKYAAVSGDFNPHHLSMVCARMFGFKKAIAHGMWSLARVVASLEKTFGIHDAARIEAAFKRPIFMPATLGFGYGTASQPGQDQHIINFELYDAHKELLHLKGKILYKNLK